MGTISRREREMAPAGVRPFLITIDTEGDNLWAAPRVVTTTNARFLPRFQSLCETYGFKPTYLTDYDMVRCPVFQEFGRDVLKRETGEIGLHLHAWNTPPIFPLTDDDVRHQPYLIEYSDDVMRKKIEYLTSLLEDTFQTKMRSHRAGRWSFDERYARMLAETGYTVDCSVTPHVSWAVQKGDPRGAGGSDYSAFPEGAYFLDLNDIRRPGDSPLLEVPVTIRSFQPPWINRLQRALPEGSYPWRVVNYAFPPRLWLRPKRGNRRSVLRVVRSAAARNSGFAEFMLHSSELMPGGSPNFTTAPEVDRLYEDLEAIFTEASGVFRGSTLSEFRAAFERHSTGAAAPA